MQNRNMFLYRRQGPKKRPKSGTPRKGRNQQKGLPTSARDLLPIIQPATKALAQMLAGHSAASGQLGHARAVLAQTEKLVAERAHNRLNPAEREEFFEQVARLKLTLSDAESEAEFQAAEEQAAAPVTVPVDRERLKAMALSLTSSSSKDSANGRGAAQHGLAEDRAGSDPATEVDATETKASGMASTAPDGLAGPDRPSADPDNADAPASKDDEPASKTVKAKPARKRAHGSEQLRLPRETTDDLSLQAALVGAESKARRRKPKVSAAAEANAPAKTRAKTEKPKNASDDAAASEDSADAKNAGSQKLPKGWIIDEEGFVVPGPS